MNESEFQNLLESLGGQLYEPTFGIKERLKNVKAMIFDWDGVFNNGEKGVDQYSNFTESDSMGVNLLRFGLFLMDKGEMPFTAIITGENNQSAYEFAQREHFDAVYYRFAHKVDTLKHLKDNFNINPSEILFVFDDLLDLSLAQRAGLRCLVRDNAKMLFGDYARQKRMCEYRTAHQGGENAVREVAEVLLGLSGWANRVFDKRMAFDDDYTQFVKERKEINTRFFTKNNEDIEEVGRP